MFLSLFLMTLCAEIFCPAEGDSCQPGDLVTSPERGGFDIKKPDSFLEEILGKAIGVETLPPSSDSGNPQRSIT